MAAIALVDMDAFDLTTGKGLGFLNDLTKCMAIIRAAGQCLGMEDELASLAAVVGGGERDPRVKPEGRLLTPNS